jgi:hypothetical protein
VARVLLTCACALGFLASAVLASAQSAQNRTVSSLLVNVLDRDGNAIRDLTKDDFRVKVNGHPVPLLDLHYTVAPRRIVVLLDMSGSMKGVTEKSTKWNLARLVLDDLLAETASEVPIALFVFSSQVDNVFNFSEGRPSITKWLGRDQRPDSKGSTAFYDALAAAARLLEPVRPGDAIYAITDGGENHSQISRSAAKQRLVQAQIRFFAFLFSEPAMTDEERSGVESVEEFARDTGGFVFGVSARPSLASDPSVEFRTHPFVYDDDKSTRDRINLCTRALNVQIQGFYHLQLDSPPAVRKSSRTSLEIVDASGKVRKGLTWMYQRALPAGDK